MMRLNVRAPWARALTEDYRGHNQGGGQVLRRGFTISVSALLVASLATVLTPRAASANPAPDAIAHPLFNSSYLNGVSGPKPTVDVDLAGTWLFDPLMDTTCKATGTLGPQQGCVNTQLSEHTTIAVPGGGWVKQGFTTLSEAEYIRTITVPNINSPQTTEVTFGAVDFQAQLSVDGTVVGTKTTSFLPSTFNITPYVKPGGTYTLSVLVKGRDALMDSSGYYTVPDGADWSPNIAEGIFRSADLEVYPSVYISDAFIETSVTHHDLRYQVSITNTSNKEQSTRVQARLSSWNHSRWVYPSLPSTTVTVGPDQTRKVWIGPVPWNLGPKSYWWPDVPYRADYRAQLHDLHLDLVTPSEHEAVALYQFGFRQIEQVGDHFDLNGIRVNFRGDDIQEADYDSIDYGGGPGDAYDTLPGFLAPSKGNPGWPQAVENYLRLNYNDVRIHQIPATPYMLDIADQRGLMILDETAIRGSNLRQSFATGLPNMVSDARDLVLRDRNHASVLRWSEANEPVSIEAPPGSGVPFLATLYSAIMALDPTRPISADEFNVYQDLPESNFTVWCHYVAENGVGFGFGYSDNSCKGAPGLIPGKPYGIGEFLDGSGKQNFEWFATATEVLRTEDASDVRPYTLLNNWASFVPGVNSTEMTLEQGGHPLYGVNNLANPWANPQIQRIQKAYSPVLVADQGYWNANKLSNTQGDWPSVTVSLPVDRSVTRTLEIFNDTFSGTSLQVKWQLRAGSATGPVVHARVLNVQVPLGGHVARQITFTTPNRAGPLYLVLSASKQGQGGLFFDAGTKFN